MCDWQLAEAMGSILASSKLMPWQAAIAIGEP